MSKAEEMGFVQQVRFELNKRITQTDNICKQFKNSYSKYPPRIQQISLLTLLGIIALALIWAMLNIDAMFIKFSMQNYEHNRSLAIGALVSIFLYIALHIYKNTMHILRIANVYKLVYEVQRIRKYLESNLYDLSNIATKVEIDVFSQTNNELKPDYDVDADIAKYDNILRTYQNPDDSALNVVLVATHWLSGILFMGILLFISTPFIAEKISEWIYLKEYSFTSLIYIVGVIALYIILQELFAKISMLYMSNMLKKIAGYFFTACIFGILLYIIFGTGNVNLPGNTMQVIQLDRAEYLFPSYFSAFIEKQTNLNYFGFIRSISLPYIPLVICVFFISIICYICKVNEHIKHIIGYTFTVGIFVISGYLFLSLNFFSFVETIDEILSLGLIAQMFLIYAPLMIITFYLSIISIICKIKDKIISVVLGSSVIYTATFLIIDIYTTGIK